MNVLRHWRIGLLGLGVSVLALYVIFSQLDLRLLGEALRSARYIYLLPSVLFVLLGLMARAVRWQALLSEGLPLGRAFSILNVAYFVNGVLPLRIGEVARAFLASRADPPVPMMKSASTIIVERLLDVLAVLVILGLALINAPLIEELRSLALFFTPAVIVGFAVLLLLAWQRDFALKAAAALTGRVALLRRLRLVDWLAHFLDGLVPLTQPARLAKVLVWTTIAWTFSLASGFVLMYAFFDAGDWTVTALFTVSASFAVAVPAVPGNLGTYELSILLALGAMGYGEPASTATAFAVVVHAVNLAMNALLGIIGFIQEGISLEQLSQGVRGLQQPLG